MHIFAIFIAILTLNTPLWSAEPASDVANAGALGHSFKDEIPPAVGLLPSLSWENYSDITWVENSSSANNNNYKWKSQVVPSSSLTDIIPEECLPGLYPFAHEISRDLYSSNIRISAPPHKVNILLFTQPSISVRIMISTCLPLKKSSAFSSYIIEKQIGVVEYDMSVLQTMLVFSNLIDLRDHRNNPNLENFFSIFYGKQNFLPIGCLIKIKESLLLLAQDNFSDVPITVEQLQHQHKQQLQQLKEKHSQQQEYQRLQQQQEFEMRIITAYLTESSVSNQSIALKRIEKLFKFLHSFSFIENEMNTYISEFQSTEYAEYLLKKLVILVKNFPTSPRLEKLCDEIWEKGVDKQTNRAEDYYNVFKHLSVRAIGMFHEEFDNVTVFHNMVPEKRRAELHRSFKKMLTRYTDPRFYQVKEGEENQHFNVEKNTIQQMLKAIAYAEPAGAKQLPYELLPAKLYDIYFGIKKDRLSYVLDQSQDGNDDFTRMENEVKLYKESLAALEAEKASHQGFTQEVATNQEENKKKERQEVQTKNKEKGNKRKLPNYTWHSYEGLQKNKKLRCEFSYQQNPS